MLDSFQDLELLQLFKKVELLGEDEQQIVKNLLDAFVFKEEMMLRLGK